MKTKTKTQTVALRGSSELWNALFPYLAPTQIQTTWQTSLVFERPDPRSKENITNYKGAAFQPQPAEASMQMQKYKLDPRQGLSSHGVLVNRFMAVRAVLPVANAAVPNPSLEARPNIKTPGPRSGLAHFPPRGPGVLLSVPPQLER